MGRPQARACTPGGRQPQLLRRRQGGRDGPTSWLPGPPLPDPDEGEDPSSPARPGGLVLPEHPEHQFQERGGGRCGCLRVPGGSGGTKGHNAAGPTPLPRPVHDPDPRRAASSCRTAPRELTPQQPHMSSHLPAPLKLTPHWLCWSSRPGAPRELTPSGPTGAHAQRPHESSRPAAPRELTPSGPTGAHTRQLHSSSAPAAPRELTPTSPARSRGLQLLGPPHLHAPPPWTKQTRGTGLLGTKGAPTSRAPAPGGAEPSGGACRSVQDRCVHVVMPQAVAAGEGGSCRDGASARPDGLTGPGPSYPYLAPFSPPEPKPGGPRSQKPQLGKRPPCQAESRAEGLRGNAREPSLLHTGPARARGQGGAPRPTFQPTTPLRPPPGGRPQPSQPAPKPRPSFFHREESDPFLFLRPHPPARVCVREQATG
nr:proline-rich protein 2-like [Vulpes vulpes]